MTERRGYGGWLELDREALLHNLAGIRRLSEPARVMAVVKANAYGAGASGLATVLQDAGVDLFAVATVAEGVALRDDGVGGDILCLTYFDAGDVDAIRRHRLSVTVHSDESLSTLREAARDGLAPFRVWVKVDTGLGRLGVPVEEAPGVIEGMLGDPRMRIAGVFSTLAESRDRDREQLARLLGLRDRLPALEGVCWSIASSHGILTVPDAGLDVVRPGIALLGLPPSEPERMDPRRVSVADLTPIVSWKTRIGFVRTVPAGEQVGYGDRAPLERDTRVGGLMIGWADGYAGSEASESRVLVGGESCRVLALSANTTLVDVGAVPMAKPGDEAVLLGRQGEAGIRAGELARAGGGAYRMLAGIPSRVPRIWA